MKWNRSVDFVYLLFSVWEMCSLCVIDRAWGQPGQRGAAGERIPYMGIQEGERTHCNYISDFNQGDAFCWCTPPTQISCFPLNHRVPLIQIFKTDTLYVHMHLYTCVLLSVSVLGPYWFWVEFLEWVGVAISFVVFDWPRCAFQIGR